MKMPLVAICGRPNVGKSTLFNRLTRTRTALVHDLPGMTRDRSYGVIFCEEPDEVIEVVDTGGLDWDGEDVITSGITRLSEAAMRDAHVLMLVVDAHDGCNPIDQDIARRIHALGKPAILVINKIDGTRGGNPDGDFYGLGFQDVHIISAAHGDGVVDLMEDVRGKLPFHRTPEEAAIPEAEAELRFAIIGRPNVGKSSLTNKLLGYERSLVSDVAGTTRDTVDTVFHIHDQAFRLIDTAGIRRKGKTTEGAEILSILKAKQAMARADVSLLLIDAVEGVTHQDSVIAGYAQEAGAAVILVINKWDLVEKDTFTSLAIEEKIRFELGFLAHAPMIFISALTGQRVSKLFDHIRTVAEAHARRVPTGKLNAFLRDAVGAMSPHAVDGKLPKLFFMTQVGVRPPTFVIKANTDRGLHFSYMRYLENRLRDTFEFVGTPIRLSIQKKGKGEDQPGERELKAPVRRILEVGEGLKPSRRSVEEREGPRFGGERKGSGTRTRFTRPKGSRAERREAEAAGAEGAPAPVKKAAPARKAEPAKKRTAPPAKKGPASKAKRAPSRPAHKKHK